MLAVFAALASYPQLAAASQEGRRESYRLLTRDEGLAIVDAISDHHRSLRGKRVKPDCSHLVNDIYDLAGFPYPYSKSADLYRGQASFLRVSSPQPGDLIVWRGHVGLVLEPRQHLQPAALGSGHRGLHFRLLAQAGTPFLSLSTISNPTLLTARQITPKYPEAV